jgi:hypothetical protein
MSFNHGVDYYVGLRSTFKTEIETLRVAGNVL